MQLYLGNHFLAATRGAAVANANFATAEQLIGCQCCQGCEEKNEIAVLIEVSWEKVWQCSC